jgi:hypothetical protein
MTKLLFILSRLWQYLNLYFLKPFDAINDTLTSSLLSQLDWDGPIVELGSGDGEFSYVMHGGTFPIWFDRYLLTDLNKTDIYDTHHKNVLTASKKLLYPEVVVAIDARKSHVEKIQEIGFAKKGIWAEYESLPLKPASVEKIFYYTPHGLKSHDQAISEAFKTLKAGGKMLILLYDASFQDSFVCYHWAQKSNIQKIKEYYTILDNGRFKEITNLAKPLNVWREYFEEKGFCVLKEVAGLSHFAWRVYDVQTRPVLKVLIRFFNFFPMSIRTILKFGWMVVWYPFLIIFYCLFANYPMKLWRRNCYVAFEVCKRGGGCS